MSVAIKFVGTKVSKLSLDIYDKKETEPEDNFDLRFVNGYCDEDNKSFITEFTISLSSKEESFKLDLIYTGFFKTSNEINEEFRTSQFPLVNAPAIVYPFMRSFVSTVSVNAGLNPVLLPTINFQETYRQNNKPSKKVTKEN